MGQDDVLMEATQALQQASEAYGPFELGARHVTTPDGDAFLLIGVNENHEDAVAIFESWKDDWEDVLRHVGSESLDAAPEVITHEYRKPE